MSKRLHFLLGYFGSAALVAFLAACLSAPSVATFSCDVPDGEGAGRCKLVETLSAAPAADDTGGNVVSSRELVDASVAATL